MTSLPFTLHRLRIQGYALAVFLCVLSACALQTDRPSAIPPAGDASYDDPARDARARLLREAYRAFVQDRYPAAVLFFRRFVDDSQESPRMAEARWWLGRAYEQLGDYRAAMAQYRVVAAGQLRHQVNGTVYEGHALRRLDELRRTRGRQLNGQARQLALRVTPAQLPPASALSTWLAELTQSGVTALVVEPFQVPMAGHEGQKTETIMDLLLASHLAGLQVWLELDLHAGHGMDVKPDWLTTSSNGPAREEGPAHGPDVTNPAYQSFVEEFVRVLARSGWDGLFLLARPTTGFARDFSEGSFRAFSSSFALELSPEQVLASARASDGQVQEPSPTYWRWAGWKAVSYARLVARLRKVLREVNPIATTIVEVHQATLSAPLQGLEQYGEDLAELVPPTGGSVVVRQEEPAGGAPVEKLGEQLGIPERVWIGVRMNVPAVPLPVGALTAFLSDHPQATRSNLVIRLDSPRSVP